MTSPDPDSIAEHWTLVERLGEGSFGEVWRAVDRAGRPVAIKRLLRPMDEAEVAAFRRELYALEALRIPGVVGLHGSGSDATGPWIAMDLVTAPPFPGASPPVPWATLRPVVERVLATLSALHRRGFVHRDLSPNNVVVDAEGRPTVLDLGLTIQAAHDGGEAAGSPEWASPEQLAGAPVDGRSDLYTLGLLAVWALTGRHAHPGANTAARQRARIRGEAPDLDGLDPEPRRLAEALLRPLAADRPPTADAALAVLSPSAGWSPPWLGPSEPIDRLTARARVEAVELKLPRGAGATRLLAEVAARLGPDAPHLLRDRGEGPLPGPTGIRVVAGGSDALAPLQVDDLLAVFEGPERILGLQRTPARRAIAATGGRAALVVELLREWIRDGVALPQPDGRLRVDPAALDHLSTRAPVPPRRPLDDDADAELLTAAATCAGVTDLALVQAGFPDAVDRLTDLARRGAVEPGPRGTWRVLAAPPARALDPARRLALHRALLTDLGVPLAWRWPAACSLGGTVLLSTATDVVARLRDRLDPTGALGVLEAVAARASVDVLPEAAALAEVALDLALDQPDLANFARAREAAVLLGDGSVAERCDSGRLALLDGDRALDALPLPGDDAPRFALATARLRAMAATRAPARLQRELTALLDWARAEPRAALHAGRWAGILAHARGAPADAARCFADTARDATDRSSAVQLWFAAADGWLDARDASAALLALDRAAGLLRGTEWRYGHARLAVLGRIADHQLGRAHAPDVELVSVLQQGGWTYLAGRAALTEAVVAWRARHPAALDLARTCHALTAPTHRAIAALAGGLLADLGDPIDRQALVHSTTAPWIPPGVALQVLGLLRAPRALAHACIARTGGATGGEVLTGEEAMARLRP